MGGAEARRDIKAGINVALLALPQGMAYAYIAGLPIHYGIYGSALATLVGPIFSGTRFIMLGPTNATAVLLFTSFMAFNITQAEKLALMPLLVLMIGLFLVVGAFFRVANFIQYVSRTVVTGYITAAALFIVVNQIRKIFGVDFAIPEGTTFFRIVGADYRVPAWLSWSFSHPRTGHGVRLRLFAEKISRPPQCGNLHGIRLFAGYRAGDSRPPIHCPFQLAIR